MSEQELITEILGFEFQPLEMQTVNADDLLRLVAAVRANCQSQPVVAQTAGEVPKNDETGLEEWAAGKFGVGGAFRGELCGNTDWALARLVWSAALESQHTRIVAALQARAVVMPERRGLAYTDWRQWSEQDLGFNKALDEVARLNAAPVQQVSVPTHKMILAGEEQWERSGNEAPDVAAIFRAMLAAAPAAPAADAGLLDWAVDSWHREVSFRPLVNVHRSALDGTWRQVIRKLGGDPVDLCGPSHFDLINARDFGHE